MKKNDNTTRLKTYKIKNHDSGKTYVVKAVSYADAKMKYNEHILKDSITEDAVIYGEWKDKDGVWNVNTNDLQETKRKLRAAGYKYISHDVNMKGLMYRYTVQYTKDSITEDAVIYGEWEGSNKDGLWYVNTNDLQKTKRELKSAGYKFKAHYINPFSSTYKYIVEYTKDSITEDAISKLVQNYLGSKNPKTKAEQDEIINFLLERNKITKEDVQKVRSLLKIVKDSFKNDSFDYQLMYKVSDYLDSFDERPIDERWSAKKIFETVKAKFKGVNNKKLVDVLEYLYQGSRLKFAQFAKDSITEDADIAQNDIKSSYLPEDANADNIQYLGFNEKRKLSFYSYGDRYFVHYDLEGRTEEIDKATVQKILKKNILGEIDENDLINKEPQSEEIVSDAFDEQKKQERGDR